MVGDFRMKLFDIYSDIYDKYKRLDQHVVMEMLIRVREETILESINIINKLKTPYPQEFITDFDIIKTPSTEEGRRWKFGDLVFNNTKEDVIKEIKQTTKLL